MGTWLPHDFWSQRVPRFVGRDRLHTLQSAKVLGLAACIVALVSPDALAQSTGKVEVRAVVVDVAPSRAALASARWILAGKRAGRRDEGLVTVVVQREQRKVSINYLKN